MDCETAVTMNTPGPRIPHPSTVKYIAIHAARQPHNIVLLLNGREITYDAFHRNIGKMVAALKHIGLRQSQTVGVETSNSYLHWLVLLACDALDVGTMSYDHTEIPAIKVTLAKLDLVLCSPEWEPQDAKRVHHMDHAWIDAFLAIEPALPIEPIASDPDAPLRIVKSSGTTGTIKTMIQTRGVHEARLARSQQHCGFTANTRYFVALGFSVLAYHLDATACIRAGGACVFDDREPLINALGKYAITDILLLPKTLIELLNGVPESYVKSNRLRIFVLGAPVSKTVHGRVSELLSAELSESYGTNEAGAVCRMDPDGAGTVVPGVRVEVTADDDAPVFGKPGRIRIQSDGCVSGYLDDPETTEQMFRNGWFYPGDIGIMQDSRTLKIVGREDDLLNVRGIKYAPQPMEDKLIRELPITDACLTVLNDKDGIANVRIAIVPDDPGSIPYIEKNLSSLLPSTFGLVTVTVLKSIPRTNTGKIQRGKLKRILQQLQT